MEAYWLSDCTVARDANLHVTLLSRLLELCHAIFTGRNLASPAILRVRTDNAPSEGENQTSMKHLAWPVWKKAFRAAEMTMFRVGHTHNRQDQRFGEVAAALSRVQTLEAAYAALLLW